MNIRDVQTAFKIADVIKDVDHPKNHIKFVYLREIIDENGHKLSNQILRDKKGRVYLIVVDGEIVKIGGSMDKGGIKATLSFYQNSMQGRPGINRFGIHKLIEEELNKNKRIEIYLITSEEVKANVKGLFLDKSETRKIAVFKEMEDKCKQEYKEKEGSYPIWNFQENGKPWPSSIQESHNEYLSKTIKRD